MDLSLPALLSLVRDTIANPRGAARAIIDLRLPAQVGWTALALMAVAATLASYVSLKLSPPEAQAMFGKAMESPLRTAFLQLFVLVAGCFALWRIGRARGGQGSLEDSVALIAWLQFVLLVLQAVMMAVQLLVPPLGGLIGLGELVLFFWLLVNFVAELHGFRSLAATFAGVLLTLLVLVFMISLILIAVIGPAALGA